MWKLNEDKLTDYDRQVLTTTSLEADNWRLDVKGMYHARIGDFRPSLGGWGLQLANMRGTEMFRQLTWRAQILLQRRHVEMLHSAVDLSKPVKEAGTAQASPAQARGGLLGSLGGYGSMPTATQMQQQLEMMRDQFAHQRDHQLDAAKYANQMLRANPAVAISTPSSADKILGHRVGELLNLGFSHSDIAELRKLAGGGPANPHAVELFDKVAKL